MSEPTPMTFNTGNPKDDDGQVIDSFFVEVDNPPKPAPTNMVPPNPVVRPRPMDRLMTVTQSIVAGNPPIQLFPADDKRESNGLSIRWVTNGAGGDPLYLADEQGKVFFQSSSFSLTTTLPWEPYGYTGAVWVYQPSTGAGGYVTGIAVTGGKP